MGRVTTTQIRECIRALAGVEHEVDKLIRQDSEYLSSLPESRRARVTFGNALQTARSDILSAIDHLRRGFTEHQRQDL